MLPKISGILAILKTPVPKKYFSKTKRRRRGIPYSAVAVMPRVYTSQFHLSMIFSDFAGFYKKLAFETLFVKLNQLYLTFHEILSKQISKIKKKCLTCFFVRGYNVLRIKCRF